MTRLDYNWSVDIFPADLHRLGLFLVAYGYDFFDLNKKAYEDDDGLGWKLCYSHLLNNMYRSRHRMVRHFITVDYLIEEHLKNA